MAAPDRIRLTDSLRRGPRKGALLLPEQDLPYLWSSGDHQSGRSMRFAEDARLAGLWPAVLDADEPAEAPPCEELERIGVSRAIGVIEQKQPAEFELLQRRFQHVDSRHRRGFQEVDDNKVEPSVRQRLQGRSEPLDGQLPKLQILEAELFTTHARLEFGC